MRGAIGAALLLLGGCNLVLDFDDDESLPCPCNEDHVCLVASNTCKRRASVEELKSCDLGAESPDDLCESNHVCEAINGAGRRCLRRCTPSNYATPESARSVAAQCPSGQTCYATERGGVCAEGTCDVLRNNCPPGQRCAAVNATGVCLTGCDIFNVNPLPCAGNQSCHPILDSQITSCLESGPRQRNELCSDTDMCAKFELIGQIQRPLVCARPEGSQEPLRCRAICLCPPGGGSCDNAGCNSGSPCILAKAGVDPLNGFGLGICLE